MAKIFVYGTLINNMDKFVNNAKLLYDDVVLTGASLYNLGWFPGLVFDFDHFRTVTGQIWEFHPDGWERLDRYEGFSPDNPEASLYLRRRLPLGNLVRQEGMNDAFFRSRIEVYQYNSHVTQDMRIPDGKWSSVA